MFLFFVKNIFVCIWNKNIQNHSLEIFIFNKKIKMPVARFIEIIIYEMIRSPKVCLLP